MSTEDTYIERLIVLLTYIKNLKATNPNVFCYHAAGVPNGCGTPGCIAGHGISLFDLEIELPFNPGFRNIEDVLGPYLGIDDDEVIGFLFHCEPHPAFPEFPELDLYYATIDDAIARLEAYVDYRIEGYNNYLDAQGKESAE